MGAQCGKDGDGEEAKRDKAISKQLRDDKSKLARELKILLLGAGNSGKTTIIKQMKIIHNKFSKEERETYRDIVYQNCIVCARAIVTAAMKLNTRFESQKNLNAATALLSIGNQLNMSHEVAEQMEALWKEPCIQQVWAEHAKYQLHDTTEYFFLNASRFALPSYTPSDEDILYTRTRTTGVQETVFPVKDALMRITDVGGQRNERRKWIHCFADINALIFVASLSEYDEHLLEDSRVNCVDESLLLFEQVCNMDWFFGRCPIILFLNKCDLFKTKLVTSPMKEIFPDYNGDDDPEKGIGFIRGKFLERNRTKKQVVTHVTCATDTSNIRVVFNTVRKAIMHQAMQVNELQ
mmetsp:Transcript_4991/g.12437  ORF Transcript_4991/g.12437 Transcript_4991/m.12437 type:complete len:351 (+) Transcript_4991:81-1133(+)|eukprot:CAMPEP_0177662956 /NCGR_PEP_ID=MMETSP0447-20121125/19641_1 /TAXON_ID=0 /ORGANISM="Stygamoeba regulata, Strain BSH-02190019" /LENGTH=350 /DNA_ID=CAMNT_0019168705 /DNA_START=65 /DNA_END=1117 /DNA_ORIENTATION=+